MTPSGTPRPMGLTFISRDREYPHDRRPLQVRLILRLFAYTRPHAAKLNALLVMVLLRALQLPLLVWTLGLIITGPVTRRDWAGVLAGIGGYFMLALLAQVTFHFRQRLALEMGEAVVHDLRRDLFRHLLEMPLGFYTRTKVGRIISRFTSDAEAVRTGVQNVLFVSLVNLGQMLFASILMLYYDWKMFLIVLGMAPVLWLINRHFRARLSRAYREVQESYSRVTATVAESVRGIRVTQGFARQDLNADLFRELVVDHSEYNVKVTLTEAVFLPVMEINSQIFLGALLLCGGWRVMTAHTMPVSNLIQFFLLSGYFFGPIQTLANMYNNALTAMAGAERVFRFLDTPPDWVDAASATDLTALEGRVEFRHVTFAYTEGRPVLHDISFAAAPGQMTALVGATGSGKTTIVNLIAKFYVPQAGEILVDDRDLAMIRGRSLRHWLGLVLQQNFLFTGTVLENIRFGRPEATDDEVREAARRLDCLDLLEALPEGLLTRLGEQGVGLSTGQRQLVCFTRAMLADPRILILDEATSSVDAITEVRLQIALEKLLAGRTSFVVAHRLSTIRQAHQVLVLDGGKIVERGTHRQLLRLGGVYARLYRQFMLAHEL